MSGILDHLWQSTLFAALAGLLTLAFARNGARIRYHLWFAASAKFLIPFAALSALGALLPATPVAAPGLVVWRQIAVPFSAEPVPVVPTPVGPDWSSILPPLLLALWIIGAIAIVARWLLRWSRLRHVLRQSIQCPLAAPVPVKSAPSLLEPGLVGIFRPVILLPEGIDTRLSAAEMDAVLAHEICHLRRRDNLTAAAHMLVEALFWFHPLVWWLGARLNAEREQACDESVLAAGQSPQIYAESILKVCKLYLHSPLDCAAGVSGAGLKTRMETIMKNANVLPLNNAKKLLLAGAAILAIASPLAAGLLAVPPVFAQDKVPGAIPLNMSASPPRTTRDPRSEAALRRQIAAWQAHRPAFDVMTPQMARFARQDQNLMQKKFDGFGALKAIAFKGTEDGTDYYTVTFANTRQTAAISLGQDGKVGSLQLNKAIVRSNPHGPEPGTEAVLRQFIAGIATGEGAYDAMNPRLAADARRKNGIAEFQDSFRPLGALKSLTFQKVTVEGLDQYIAHYEHGSATWTAGPLVGGKLANFGFETADPRHPGMSGFLTIRVGD